MNWIEFNSFELAQLSEFGPYSTSLQRDTLWKKVETETFQPSP